MFDNITSGLFWLFVFFLFFGRKTFPILIVGGLIYAVLVWGSPRMIIGAGFVVAAVVGIATTRANLEATSAVLNRGKTHPPRYIPGFYIRRKSDGYPMTVGKAAMLKAIRTGDYEYEGEGDEIEAGCEWQDERLN